MHLNTEGAKDSGALGWVRYRPEITYASLDEESWMGIIGLRTFKIILLVSIAAVLSLVVRNLMIKGAVPWADVATAIILSAALLLLSKKPGWHKALTWIVFGVLWLDALDGLVPPWRQPITPTHVLLPMLVLYGALLCDLAITVAAVAATFAVCLYTLLNFSLTVNDKLMLFNIVLATLISGFTSLSIWIHQQRLMKDLKREAQERLVELESNSRLNSVIFHDIANPLTTLTGKLDLAIARGSAGIEELTLMDAMALRIGSVIQSVRLINSRKTGNLPKEEFTSDWLYEELSKSFASQLEAKEQTVSLVAGSGLKINSVPAILLNQVLGNLLYNSIKFSPKGSDHKLFFLPEGGGVRIELHDNGRGFPEEFFHPGKKGLAPTSAGTEGESGHGLGLGIVALYTSRLGGFFEIKNPASGGAAAAVVLP